MAPVGLAHAPSAGTAQTITGSVTATLSGTSVVKELRAATTSVTSLGDSNVSGTVIAANSSRLFAAVYNDSTVNLYLKLGATASTSSFTCLIAPGGYYEVPGGYTGVVDGIWASDASGSARITELTA